MSARALWLRLRALLRPRRAEAELAEELAFHVEMQTRKHREAGLDPVDAERRARLEFGNLELVKEDARDMRGTRPIEETLYDVRHALRSLRRTPGFALAVILTIGLGVGINASVFTIFDAYVLRPFEVRDPYSLYSVQWMDRRGAMHDVSQAGYDALRHSNEVISDVAAYRTFTARLNLAAVTGDAVSETYFAMAGVRPALGRVLIPDDRSSAVVVISHSLWQSHFGADSGVVGRRVTLRGYPVTIVGVAQPGFEGFFKKPRDFWIPFGLTGKLALGLPNERPQDRSVLARLRPGLSEAQGRAFVSSTLQATMPGVPDSAAVARVFLSSRATAIPSTVKSYLAFAPLALAFILVLLLACANVANMLLARGLTRQREIGTRMALGAPRSRIVRQLVTESVVLALPAVLVGFLLAWVAVDAGVRTLFATLPADLTAFVRLVPLHPDWRVAVYALLAAVASAFVFGVVPSLQTTRLTVVGASRGNFGIGASPTRLRNGLIVGQITIASLLLIVSGILLREAARLGRLDTGLTTHDVVSIEPEERSRTAVLESVRQSKWVDVIASAEALPLDMRFPTVSVSAGAGNVDLDAMYNRVSASYFDVLKNRNREGPRIHRGRGGSECTGGDPQ